MGKSPLLKNEKCRHNDKEKTDSLVPLDVLLEVENGEERKHHQGNDLLDGLELRGTEDVAAVAVRRYLKAVLKESDSPAHNRDFPERHVLVLEVPVPRERHKDIGDQQKNYRQHVFPYPIPRSEEDSSAVPQTRQITAEQSPQISGSVTSRAHFGQ